MKEKKVRIMKIVQVLLSLMMLGSFLFFVFGEAMFPIENPDGDGSFSTYTSDWFEVRDDGSRHPIGISGKCDVEFGEWAVIEKKLPETQNDTWICIRSMQQDMKIYVGEELRKEYSTVDTQPFGKTSTMTYVFFEVLESDAEKNVRVEFKSQSAYSGYVGEIYSGDKADIIQHFYRLYAPAAVVAALLLLVGILVSIGAVFVRVIYKRSADIGYLGTALVIAATWLMVESRIRQFIFPNSTTAMLMGFLMIAVLPYPFLTYIDNIQKKRYETIYRVLAIATVINFVAVVTLQVMNIKDFFETMTSSHIIIVALIVTMGATIAADIKKGYVRDYREVAIGFACLMIAGVFEIGLAYIATAQLNGIALCIGLVILLITAGLKTIRDQVNVEKEKQYAIAMNESKAKFLANMSHEIRTPINTIIGMNEMILRENKDKTIEEYSSNIKNAGQMLIGIVNDVLDFSKIEAGKLQIVESNYNPQNMLKDVILGMELRAAQKNLDFEKNIDNTLPTVIKGDELRIKQVMINLLSNAVKYTEKGKVSLEVKGIRDVDGFTLMISVKDTGIGIKKEDMDNLFGSFQRFELSKNRYIEGSGLGLNITKLLVELMNGSIEAESEYGKGSCFTVRLKQQIVDETPVKIKESEEKENMREQSGEKADFDLSHAKVLAVDDTNTNLMVIKALLKKTNLQLDTATGGKECLEMTGNKKYDVILMDHMMPEPDGIETLHLIRNDKENINRETPIVVLTANAIVGMREMYMEEGFDDFLSKPVDPDELERVLAKFI